MKAPDLDAFDRAGRAAAEGRPVAPSATVAPTPSGEPATAQHPPAAADLSIRRAEALALAGDLSRRPRILDAFGEAVVRAGVVGETRTAKIVFLALVSRFLEKLVSIAVKGPSSGGKSFIVSVVLKFFPGSAYYALSSMSERALVYSEEPIAHRFLILYEAAGMGGDLASYFVRSLLSEGRLRYETVEKTKKGMRPRMIEREGPTGLIVTTTATRLHPENETRLLSLTVTDTPAQTAAVLRALAADAGTMDVNPWHALQVLLETGEHRVVVPFAPELAEAIPPVAVRLRRDFGALLSLVRAHALLHQATRERDGEGRIVATLDDYSQVRDLVADIVADGVEATVPETVRETVAAVDALAVAHPVGVPVTRIARALKLDKSSASRRARKAADDGYLKNLENGKGRPARYVVGDPLPEDVPLLPNPAALVGGDRCTVAPETGGIAEESPNSANGTCCPVETEEDARILADLVPYPPVSGPHDSQSVPSLWKGATDREKPMGEGPPRGSAL